MPHTDAIYRLGAEPKSRTELQAEFRRKNSGKTFVYAISDGLAIKFGSAWDVQKRLESLQIGNPRKLRVLAQSLVARGTEPAIHKALYYQRLRGEWFRICQETCVIVDLLVKGSEETLANYICNTFSARGYNLNGFCSRTR